MMLDLPQEMLLNAQLLDQPYSFNHRYTTAAECHLRQVLFRSLAGQRDDHLRLFFPHGTPRDPAIPWSLRSAQGAIDGAEYTAAAKGTACGHIFKSGESTYHCKTCAADDTCVLCSRCFDSSDHEGHMVFISVSPGNSGCCDCGDQEAWRREVHCSIHTDGLSDRPSKQSGKEKAQVSLLPDELVAAIRMTIARAVDYLCDVFSCSPEQLRLPKTEKGIHLDEELSRLGGVYGVETIETDPEYVLVLWNDEKHTVDDVMNQVARACRESKRFGTAKANEVNDIGRSCVAFSRDLPDLIRMSTILEQIKVTVTIRSARDTFREQMCATIIDWIADISGCAVGNDSHILRNVVCEEFLKPWRMGSRATNKGIGRDGIDDHETDENQKLQKRYRQLMNPFGTVQGTGNDIDDVQIDEDDEDDEYDDMDIEDGGTDDMDMDAGALREVANIAAVIANASATVADMDIDFMDDNDDVTEALEVTLAGYPPAPPVSNRRRILTPNDSGDDGELEHGRPASNAPFDHVPRTPKVKGGVKKPLRPSKHWLEKPEAFRGTKPSEPCEDLWQRVRLDFLILYDLRLWKVLRISLRHLYITTVVTIPHFKRVLGLRFAGLYTTLAQLYLIADREPDHSIINLSVQMLTTPTITQEVVDRGNFLTNLMAILYTFLTTRQVGFPEDVSPRATLAFDAGAVTNRRIFHFFIDLRWLSQSEFIHHRMRVEPRYLLQFLDLVKLHQGVCPNIRATGEHVEYESDAWISASMIVKEINKLCKQIALSFEPKLEVADHNMHLQRAIRTIAQITMINSFGYERKRFVQAELKDDMGWHQIGPFTSNGAIFSVPMCIVQTEPMSFHHPLHYLLSWLLEDARTMSRAEMRALLHFSPDDLKDPWNISRVPQTSNKLTKDELLSSIFEHPLRVCAWLAQMKAGMWVRNGITLRHQAHTYRSVSNRDVGYQRDILMLQAGLVLCGADDERPGERFLAQMIDRFQMVQWFHCDYSLVTGFEESQQLDVIEDLFHLLVIALSERGNLVPSSDGADQHDRVLQHDIAHSLCFKPLSFSDLSSRVTERVGESDDFNRVLESMTVYRPPEGLTDSGTFELKPELIELVDPYYAHYSRNHREEAESIYRNHMARKLGRKAEEIVYEPRVQPIESGLFSDLPAFTATPLFAQVLYAALKFSVEAQVHAPKMQATRIETFLHMVLHLALLATLEDCDGSRERDSFVMLASSTLHHDAPKDSQTVVAMLIKVSKMDDYASCHPAVKLILRKMQVRQPQQLTSLIGPLGTGLDRTVTGSPASMLGMEDKERKKQEALARQAKIMAQMKQQQNSFLQNQGLNDFGDDFDDLDDMSIMEEPESISIQRKTWSFPTGTCILCQEETGDQRLYGTFAYLGESNILRSTPTDDVDYVREVVDTPINLDKAADDHRPFGVSGLNKQSVHKMTADGRSTNFRRQGLSKGFPHQPHGIKGPVSSSCGHIMHFSCFELYLTATQRRQAQQIARHHPERLKLQEFICPLCKALGNTFLPIIWKAKECVNDLELHAAKGFVDWLADVEDSYTADLSFLNTPLSAVNRQMQGQEIYSNRSYQYVASMFSPLLVSSMQDLSIESSPHTPVSFRRGLSLSSMFGLYRGTSTDSQSSQSDSQPRMTELVKAYERIDVTIGENKLGGQNQVDTGLFNPVEPLSRALGLSISSYEIAHRGVDSGTGGSTLLSGLSEQNLTHLRILSETIESYLAINILKPTGLNVVSRETIKRRNIMIAQLFGVESEIQMIKLMGVAGDHLLQDDVFLFFSDWLSFMGPDVTEATEIMQLCLWVEVVKTVFVYKGIAKEQDIALTGRATQTWVSDAFKLAVSGMTMEDTRDWHSQVPLTDTEIQFLRLVVDKYALTFLRKAIILMHTRYGVEYECPHNLNPDTPELQRLTSFLHILSIDEICKLYTSQSVASEKLRQTTKRWIQQANMIETHGITSHASITISHPAIFELVGLPQNYDILTEEALKNRCPTTGKEVTDPALCLFCGEIFCSQAYCCLKNKSAGGCYQHMAKCGGKIGMFINIRKCMVLFTHGPGNGCYAHAPYLDRHGEPDPSLRRHHQLFLNQKRYDRLLRDVWLNHGIPTVISRKLEGDVNPGGWETL
nr:e3 ubiquitin-protein ligase ubr11 [Quercus suber]